MKSSQRLIVSIEALLFITLGLLIQSVFPDMITGKEIVLRIGFLMLILYSFRRGPVPGFVASLLFGILHAGLLLPDITWQDGGQLLLTAVMTMSMGIAGLFARNLQRTLHNKRMSSVYLNLVTGTFLSLITYFGIQLAIDYWVYNETAVAFSEKLTEWGLSFGMNFVMILLVLILLLNIQAKYFIPKQTPYISRKERSRLLND